MEEKGAHEKRSGPAGAQRASGHLFRGADTRGRAGAEGTRTEAEEVAQKPGETAAQVGGQRRARGLGHVAQRMGIATGQQ